MNNLNETTSLSNYYLIISQKYCQDFTLDAFFVGDFFTMGFFVGETAEVDFLMATFFTAGFFTPFSSVVFASDFFGFAFSSFLSFGPNLNEALTYKEIYRN